MKTKTLSIGPIKIEQFVLNTFNPGIFFIILTLLLLLVISAYAQINEVSGFQNPESVVACGNKLYVSNMGAKLDPTAKDGDGFISMLSRKDGKIIEEKFITGLNSPKGMIIRCGKLYIADVDKVLIFCLKNKKKVKECDLSAAGIVYANDLIRDGRGVFVSATDKNAIYKIYPHCNPRLVEVKGDIPGVNGLANACCKVYVANYGRGENPTGSFGKVNWCTRKYTELGTGGSYDGIVKVCNRLLVTDWVSQSENKGRILVYNIRKKSTVELPIGRTIGGPADMYADCRTHTLWVPAMRENKILGIPFEMIKKAK